MSVQVPIILIFFNRYDTTMQVLNSIKAAKPIKLYLVSDGARTNVEGEEKRVKELRHAVEQEINWECSVQKIYADRNMGCHKRMVSGITEVFKKEERAIIIEDDIVPIQSFYRYCEELLERYKNDEQIFFVSGNNMMQQSKGEESYMFSKYPSIWGWATWKRAWQQYDDTAEGWEMIKKSGCLDKYFGGRRVAEFYAAQFGKAFTGECDTWDYQWEASRMYQGGIGIIPKFNLINNIGFNREDATHTKGGSQYDFSTQELTFPLVHPVTIEINKEYDDLYRTKIIDAEYFRYSIPGKILKKVSDLIRGES